MAKQAKEPKNNKGSEKKPNWFVRNWRALKSWSHEMKVELKKVHWPTRSELVKACLAVLACVLIVGIFVWILDGVAAAVINALLHLVKG